MNWALFFQAISAIASFAVAATIIIGVLQLRAMCGQTQTMQKQLADSQEWNRMNAALLHLPNVLELNDIEIDLNGSFIRLIDRTEPLSQQDIEKLNDPQNNKIFILLKNYLNMLEFYCVAINFGLIDDDVAKAIYRHKFERHYTELEPFIQHIRAIRNSNTIFSEFQETIERWRQGRAPHKRYAG